jgi:hypothetical protein
MKSIQRRFERLEQSRPIQSSYENFAGAVENGHFTLNMIQRWFKRLVEKDDYSKSDKKALFAHLSSISNTPTTTENRG